MELYEKIRSIREHQEIKQNNFRLNSFILQKM